MHYVDRAGYAMREFYARNPRLAPRASSPWKRLVVCTFLLLLGAGAAGGAYFTTKQVNTARLVELIEKVVR